GKAAGAPRATGRINRLCRPRYALRVEAVSPGETRLRSLLDAIAAVTGELSLDAVLQRLIEVAVELTGARYGALGVIDRSGSQLERFITTGIDDEARAAIGDLPR